MRWRTMLWWQRDANAGRCHADEREQQLGKIQHRQLQAIRRLELEIKLYRAQSQLDAQDAPRADH